MAPTLERHAPASFAVPRAAVRALLNQQAAAVTIGAYLVLSCHTDGSGRFSTAGLHAVREHLGINRTRAEKAVGCLATMKPPLIWTRDAWEQDHPGQPLPDGPTDRSQVRFVLPTFGETLDAGVWIGSGLVHGDAVIPQPLRALRDCGDVAARALLALYAGQDLVRWYGIPPHGFPWVYYTLQERTAGACRALLATKSNVVMSTSFRNRVSHSKKWDLCFAALDALRHAGLLYEAIVLLNRHPVPDKFKNTGKAYAGIPTDADILCDVATLSPWGAVPEQEEALGAAYEETLHALAKLEGCPDIDTYLSWEGKDSGYEHCAVTATSQAAMMAGLYRLRFRVINPRNAFVGEATRRRRDARAAAVRQLNYLRQIHKLAPLPSSTLQSSSISLNPLNPSPSSSSQLNPPQGELHGEKNRKEGGSF